MEVVYDNNGTNIANWNCINIVDYKMNVGEFLWIISGKLAVIAPYLGALFLGLLIFYCICKYVFKF